MDATETAAPKRGRRHVVSLGPELDRRLEAARLARNPAPSRASMLRAAVEAGLGTLEVPGARSGAAA
jgi:hypothetical protein